MTESQLSHFLVKHTSVNLELFSLESFQKLHTFLVGDPWEKKK